MWMYVLCIPYVVCILVAIMAVVKGIYLIYRFVNMPKRDLRFGEGQTLQRLNELSDVLKADYIYVFRREGEDEYFEYGTLYYNPEAKVLEVVCDSDYSEYNSEGYVKLDLPLMGRFVDLDLPLVDSSEVK